MKSFEPVEVDGVKKPRIININSENRVLPFQTKGWILDCPVFTELTPKGGQIIGSKRSYDKFVRFCEAASKSDTVEVVINDSLTRMLSKIEADIRQETRDSRDKYIVWSEYGEKLSDMFERQFTKLNDKILIVTAHETSASEKDKSQESRVPVKGFNKEIGLESFFDIVLWTTINADGTVKEGTKYQFQTCPNPDNRAKTPPGMFDEDDEMFIENDIMIVLERWYEYYKDEDVIKPPKILIVGRTGSGKSTSLRNLVKGE